MSAIQRRVTKLSCTWSDSASYRCSMAKSSRHDGGKRQD
jgi:hypothetical protein